MSSTIMQKFGRSLARQKKRPKGITDGRRQKDKGQFLGPISKDGGSKNQELAVLSKNSLQSAYIDYQEFLTVKCQTKLEKISTK